MAVNPMQRKARNSFLLGIILTLLITGAVIAFLIIQLKNAKDEYAAELAARVTVYTLNQDVKSGQVLTEDMFTKQSINKTTIPSNATSVASVIDTWFLQTKDGSMLYTDQDGLYMIDSNGDEVRVEQENNGNYYIEKTVNRETTKEYLEINNVPVVAKIDMKANTVITPNLVVQSDEVITDDVRREEYNMISLPIDLMSDEYVDIRIMFPSGQNFIVVSKALVTVPQNPDGTYVADTIWMNLREDEILLMSSAIVEAYGIQGAKIYATKYAEPGMQSAATPTYVPNQDTLSLIQRDPNIVENAMNGLKARLTQAAADLRNQYVQSIINGDQAYSTNVQTGMETGITNSDSARKDYLDSLQY